MKLSVSKSHFSETPQAKHDCSTHLHARSLKLCHKIGNVHLRFNYFSACYKMTLAIRTTVVPIMPLIGMTGRYSAVVSEEVLYFATYHFRTGSRPSVANVFQNKNELTRRNV